MYICNMGSCDTLEHAITRSQIDMATNPKVYDAIASSGRLRTRRPTVRLVDTEKEELATDPKVLNEELVTQIHLRGWGIPAESRAPAAA